MPEPNQSFDTMIIAENSTLIVGLSGGPDSIYLIYQLHAIAKEKNLTLVAAHLDHVWQESSNIATKICQKLCTQLNIRLIVKKLPELNCDLKWNGSQEEIGRTARRYFFEMIAQQFQASNIVLAHHQQDQQETFFIRLIRGASLTGLSCMQPIDGLYLRPMLKCTKEHILDFLHQNKIDYYTDPSNTSDTYLRNRIRNHLLPALYAIDQRSIKHVSSAIEHIGLVDNFIDAQATQYVKEHTTHQGLNIKLFLEQHSILQQQILIRLLIMHDACFSPSQKLLHEIIRFLQHSSSKSHIMGTNWMILKNKNCFIIQNLKKIDKTL